MPEHEEPSALRKFGAALFVFTLLAGVHWYIAYRSRPPQPPVEFPKELRDIAP